MGTFAVTASTHPFTAQVHTIGTTTDGRALTLSPMIFSTAQHLAVELSRIDPWAHYGATAARMQSEFITVGDGAVRYQLTCNDTPAGVVIIRSPWLVGPYLQLLGVLPALQSSGAGTAVLNWCEAQAISARMRNVWLCVAGVNVRAQRFYERHGYECAGRLPDLIRDNDDELLMRKVLGTQRKS